jgi:hypothetical protein
VRRKFAFASNLGAMAELTGGVYRPDEVNLGDAFGWASRDPDWISKLLLMGLVGLIPIVGALQLAGWMLAALDNLRAGRHEVPPAAFRYATRGVWLFLASFIYAIAFAILFYGGFFAIFFALTPAGSTTAGHQTSSSGPTALLLFPLMFGYMGFVGLFFLGIWILVPLIIEFTDRRGLAGAFNFGGFIRAVRANPMQTFAAGGLALMTYFISGTGTYLCYVGIIFTMPYSLTVLAGVLRWYETRVRPGTLPA